MKRTVPFMAIVALLVSACAEADPYVAIFVDPNAVGFDPAEEPTMAAARGPFLIFVENQVYPFVEFDPLAGGRPVEGVIERREGVTDDAIVELQAAWVVDGGDGADRRC